MAAQSPASDRQAVTDDTPTPVVGEARRVTWHYARKTRPAEYESEEVSIHMTDVVPDGESVAEFLRRQSEAAIAMLKIETWNALGITFSVDANGVPTPDAPPAPPPPPQQQPQQQRSGGGGGGGQSRPQPRPSGGGGSRGGQQPTVAQIGYYADHPQFCKDCGQRDFYDNRLDQDDAMRNGQRLRPDWKCKNCGKGVFRPGSYQYNQQIPKTGDSGGGGGGQQYDLAPPGFEVPPPPGSYDDEPF